MPRKVKTAGSVKVAAMVAVAAVAAFALSAREGLAADPDARRFAAQALALRASGAQGDAAAGEFLARMPGADEVTREALPRLWSPFFHNAIVKLGRLTSPAPVALYYNPLLDVAIVTVWEKYEWVYRVVSARAVPGERLFAQEGEAPAPLRPAWMASENDPITALGDITAERLETFRRAHPAEAKEGGRDEMEAGRAVDDFGAAGARIVWDTAQRVQWAAGVEPWLEPALTKVEGALAKRDAGALVAAAPETGAETAAALVELPTEFLDGFTLDMAVETDGPERLLIGSRPDDGDLYVFVLCRLAGADCALRRFALASILK